MLIPDRDKKGLAHVQFTNKTPFSEKRPLYIIQTRSYEETYWTLYWSKRFSDHTTSDTANVLTQSLYLRTTSGLYVDVTHDARCSRGWSGASGGHKYTMYYFLYLTKPNALSDYNVCLSHTGSQALSLSEFHTHRHTHSLSHTHTHIDALDRSRVR